MRSMRFEGTSNSMLQPMISRLRSMPFTQFCCAGSFPLLVKGEPGTGKTVLAHEIAKAVGAPLIEWNVKSTTKAQQGLYEYDAVARLRDGQLGTSGSTTSRTTSKRASCGKPSPRRNCPSC
jgi:transcriptional regulator of acetoin/glycerol metabolism